MLIVWSAVAGVLTAGVLVGIRKMLGDVQRCREDLGREKAPWERAMADFDRSRK